MCLGWCNHWDFQLWWDICRRWKDAVVTCPERLWYKNWTEITISSAYLDILIRRSILKIRILDPRNAVTGTLEVFLKNVSNIQTRTRITQQSTHRNFLRDTFRKFPHGPPDSTTGLALQKQWSISWALICSKLSHETTYRAFTNGRFAGFWRMIWPITMGFTRHEWSIRVSEVEVQEVWEKGEELLASFLNH